MTYNFDAERWYDNNLAQLQARRARGEIDQAAFEEAVRELDRRHDEMTERLDHAYVLHD